MKKFFAALLVLALALTGLSGCGGEGSEGGSNELTIAVLREDGFLTSAARKFEEMHDGRYIVTIVVYDDFTTYSQMISAALMGGRGEDIISASHLTWQRLADTNRLVDLNGKINLEPGKYYQSVMDAFLHNGGRYVIPLNFTMDAISFNDMVTTNINPNRFSLEDLLDLADRYPEIPLMASPMGMNGTILAFKFFTLNFHEYIDLVNRTANVNNDSFITLLENVESIAYRLRWPMPGEELLIMGNIFFNATMSSAGLVDYTAYHLMTNSAGGALVSTHSLMALNANSQNQELAARFIEFLISEEMQTSPEMWANPINRNAAIESSRAMLESVRAGGYEPVGFDLERNIAEFNRLAGRLTVAGTSDPFIGDFVRTEMTRFFNGEVSAQQAASNLQARLTTYLNE